MPSRAYTRPAAGISESAEAPQTSRTGVLEARDKWTQVKLDRPSIPLNSDPAFCGLQQERVKRLSKDRSKNGTPNLGGLPRIAPDTGNRAVAVRTTPSAELVLPKTGERQICCMPEVRLNRSAKAYYFRRKAARERYQTGPTACKKMRAVTGPICLNSCSL